MPDPTKPFVVESDASKFATGAVLRQRDINGDWHPCRYISHSFDATQRNYEIYDRELLGIIRALEVWRHYLLGSQHPVTIFSDLQKPDLLQDRPEAEPPAGTMESPLSQFDLKLVHVPGSQMVQSDALSRRPDLAPEDDNDNADLTLLPDYPFCESG